jgi:histidyl-tRNA synthetase
VAGGGRYDRLVESLGGRPLPAVGFGFGDAVIHELLAERGKLPELPRRIDAVVYPFSEAERPAAVRLARRLRERGEAVELMLAAVKPKRALADADKAGAVRIYLVGPDERARGVAKVRELATGQETDVPLPAAEE